jgi:hypothetical protein
MKKTRLDKKTRLKLKALALLESPYVFSSSQSWVRGFSIHGGKSKSSTMEAIKNGYENKVIALIDKNIASQ